MCLESAAPFPSLVCSCALNPCHMFFISVCKVTPISRAWQSHKHVIPPTTIVVFSSWELIMVIRNLDESLLCANIFWAIIQDIVTLFLAKFCHVLTFFLANNRKYVTLFLAKCSGNLRRFIFAQWWFTKKWLGLWSTPTSKLMRREVRSPGKWLSVAVGVGNLQVKRTVFCLVMAYL